MCKIEISHMGKDNGNPDLVCENHKSLLIDKFIPEFRESDVLPGKTEVKQVKLVKVISQARGLS